MCRQVAELIGVETKRVKDFYFAEEVLRGIETGEISDDEFYDRLCNRFDCRPDRAALAYAASAIFEVNASIVALVSQLYSAGHPLGVLSNTCQAHWDYCTGGRYGIIPALFDVNALSFQIGAVKPERAIYDAAAKLAGVSPERIFYVDDIEANVLAAREAGFDAEPYTSTQQLSHDLRRRGVRFNY
jgi:putative hydrolase of the HAD superfamily